MEGFLSITTKYILAGIFLLLLVIVVAIINLRLDMPTLLLPVIMIVGTFFAFKFAGATHK
jgi:hypothetical protein